MTPQCRPTFHYTKQPLLLTQNASVTLFNSSNNNTGSSSSSCSNNRKKTKDEREKNIKKIKCVIVGDQAVGKTSLAVSYSDDRFPRDYVPTAYDNYNVEVMVDDKPVRVELCDTAGEDELNPLRHLCYPGTDVIMLCFSIVKPETFLSACTRWADELMRLNVPVVLVGTQADLRDNDEVIHELRRRGNRPVHTSDAKGLAERLKAPYIETSALTCNQLKEAFDMAIVIALRRQKKNRKWWRKLLCCCCCIR